MPALTELVQMQTLAEAFAAVTRDSPERLAFADDSGTLTFGQLARDVENLARSLHAAGIGRGDRVGLLLPAGLEFPRVFWALQRVGAIPCAMNPYAPAAALVRRAGRIQPARVLYDAATIPDFAPAATALPILSLKELAVLSGPLPPPAGQGDDLAWLQPTSGTSGEPRLAMIRQRNAIETIRSINYENPFNLHSIHVAWVPPWHDLGLVRFIIGSVFVTAPCHIVPPAIHTIPKWLETVSRTGAKVTGAPDFAWRIATQLVDPSLDLSTLKYALSGGEPVRLGTIRAFEEKFRLQGSMHAGYGLAEATLAVAFQRFGHPVVADDRGHVSSGRAANGVEVRIDAGDGEPGEILVQGKNVFAGYFEAPESTAEVLRDGWLHTGDIGRLDGEGYLYVLGRRKAMLKRGGAVLAPREIEEAASAAAGVKLAVAVGLAPRAEQSTESIVVAVELNKGTDAAGAAAGVAEEVQAALGFAPDRVLVLSSRSIPITWNGKIRHAALRDELASGALEQKGAIVFDSWQ